MIKVLIVEDEALVAEDISESLRENGYDITGIAHSGDECMRSVSETFPDVVLMDITIKGELNGIEIAQILNEERGLPIIFLTANTDMPTLKKALSTLPRAILTKPFDQRELSLAIELAFQHHNKAVIEAETDKPTVRNAIFIKTAGLYKKIQLKDILYIEADGSYSRIVTTSESHMVSSNLVHFDERVNNPLFCRIHRSYIINVEHVDGIDGHSLIVGKHNIPVGKSYQSEIFNLFRRL